MTHNDGKLRNHIHRVTIAGENRKEGQIQIKTQGVKEP